MSKRKLTHGRERGRDAEKRELMEMREKEEEVEEGGREGGREGGYKDTIVCGLSP